MVFNTSIQYRHDELFIDEIPVSDIVKETGTPIYIYSLKRAVENYHRLETAFSEINTHIHYSAKANSNLAVLKVLASVGAGIDTVSMGEIYKALQAGVAPQDIVFAGVGKTPQEIDYAVQHEIGWFNVENVLELDYIQASTEKQNVQSVRVALRLNPQVTANTHPYISTGHGGAKFGLTAEVIRNVLANQSDYPRIEFAGIHLHIGSQLGDKDATVQAVEQAVALSQPYEHLRYINMGGGIPVAYRFGEDTPTIESFAESLIPLLDGYHVLLEPGRSVIADAGILVTEVQYVKQQAGQTFYIVDGSMAELIRPSLYQAHHEVVPLHQTSGELVRGHIVGPVCETADVLAKDRDLPILQVGETVAVLTAGAYGMVMASNYNARLRPAEVVVDKRGTSWTVARQRETLDDLLRHEL